MACSPGSKYFACFQWKVTRRHHQLTILKEQQTRDTKDLSTEKNMCVRAEFMVSVWKVNAAVKKLTGYTDK